MSAKIEIIQAVSQSGNTYLIHKFQDGNAQFISRSTIFTNSYPPIFWKSFIIHDMIKSGK
jgi:hypothetical protein